MSPGQVGLSGFFFFLGGTDVPDGNGTMSVYTCLLPDKAESKCPVSCQISSADGEGKGLTGPSRELT